MNTSYKLFMGIIKDKIDGHIHRNDKVNDLQSGSTRGRRVEDNLFILSYCIQKTFLSKDKLYVISIDFSKAFDSVDRNMLIETLKVFKIHPKIIDVTLHVHPIKYWFLFQFTMS